MTDISNGDVNQLTWNLVMQLASCVERGIEFQESDHPLVVENAWIEMCDHTH